MQNNLLHAEGLTIRSDEALLVDNISFSVGRERVALVGESGSGKSLTARSLMGLLSPALHLRPASSRWPVKMR